jgi:hypothetical protein
MNLKMVIPGGKYLKLSVDEEYLLPAGVHSIQNCVKGPDTTGYFISSNNLENTTTITIHSIDLQSFLKKHNYTIELVCSN